MTTLSKFAKLAQLFYDADEIATELWMEKIIFDGKNIDEIQDYELTLEEIYSRMESVIKEED